MAFKAQAFRTFGKLTFGFRTFGKLTLAGVIGASLVAGDVGAQQKTPSPGDFRCRKIADAGSGAADRFLRQGLHDRCGGTAG